MEPYSLENFTSPACQVAEHDDAPVPGTVVGWFSLSFSRKGMKILCRYCEKCANTVVDRGQFQPVNIVFQVH